MPKATVQREFQYPNENIKFICERLATATPLELFEFMGNVSEDLRNKTLEALISSKKSDWQTPVWLFAALHREFDFCMDAAANATNTKLPLYITAEMDTLKADWADFQISNGIYPYRTVFMNPPWGQRRKADGTFEELYSFVQKARDECCYNGVSSVLLLPNKVEAQWFYDFAPQASEVRFFKGRINYEESPGVRTENGSTVGSLILVFRYQPGVTGPPRYCYMSNKAKDYEGIQ